MFFREWFAVFCVLCFIATLFLAEEFPCKSLFQVGQPAEIQKIQVEILGAVERPGMYEVEVGSSLLELVSRAGLKKTADKGALYLKKRVLNSCSVTVPEKKCRKSRKKKQSSSSIAVTSYAMEASGNPFKMSAL